ncbi:hypothetical protein L6452_32567 [Arctium lappa]|uniref:Uncharacterized protein n=1 Tax=Arctium lappa TaxID=4217 RepID=A0ACB8Z619_ARCLA|nr:hypothetical protein L6452_32567 [Arctium lappa]
MESTQPQANRPKSDSDASQERASQEFWKSCVFDVEEATVIGFINCRKDEIPVGIAREDEEDDEVRDEGVAVRSDGAQKIEGEEVREEVRVRETTFEKPLQKSKEQKGHPVSAEEPSLPIVVPKVVSFKKIVILVNTGVRDDEEEATFKHTKKTSTFASTSANTFAQLKAPSPPKP